MASGPITSWQIDGETVDTEGLYFGGLQNHCRWWLQPWNQKTPAPWKKSYDPPSPAPECWYEQWWCWAWCLGWKCTAMQPFTSAKTKGSFSGTSWASTEEVGLVRLEVIPFKVISSVQSLSCVWLFATPGTTACQASLYITNSWSLLKLMSVELVMPPNHLILCHSLLLPPSIFPSIRVFSNESALPIRWPKYWHFSFSISPSNEYSGLVSFRMDGWISLQSKGLSRIFSNTTVQKNQFFGTQLFL